MTKAEGARCRSSLGAGDLITVFDAEDRPETRHCASALRPSPPARTTSPACRRGSSSTIPRRWFPTMFAIEYAMLFDGLLPWLARGGYPFLLGGTSNHFRRSALLAVGGWDPWNVTEDADLALRRLAAAGCRSGLLRVPPSRRPRSPCGRGCASATRWLKAGYRPGSSTCAIPHAPAPRRPRRVLDDPVAIARFARRHRRPPCGPSSSRRR